MPHIIDQIGVFPQRRMRRNRGSEWLRRLIRETSLSVDDLIWPIFIVEDDETKDVEDNETKDNIQSMPGVKRLSVEQAACAATEAAAIGIPCIAPFPCTNASLRNSRGSESLNPNNLICRTIRAMKQAAPGVGVLTDVALDPYTSHGQDGIMEGRHILNDATVEILCEQAVNQAKAGADIIAPSDMMDGRVGAIRQALDNHDFSNIPIMAYAAKYASAFYSPFRDVIGSKAVLNGDKRTYQMDPGNSNEAIHEVALDLAEGADAVIIKPGMLYLDICRRVKDSFGMPTFGYQVSGEYAMIQAAGHNGWIDSEQAMLESLMAFKRAGCDGILTYFAPAAARILQA